MTDVILETRNLKKSFGKLEVLKGISTEIRRGEVVSIIGPSGGGKSTFLRCLNLLETPDSGQVLFKRQDITDKKLNISQYRQSIGMVFQHFNVFPNLTVLENVTLAPVLEKKVPKDQAKEEAMALLRRVGLGDKANEYPRKLSGGQKQRLAIVRAMAMKPEVMLFDEPTSAGPGNGQGGPERHPGADPQRHDHPHRHPRDGLRPGDIRPGALHL